jgi:hypothetical protein
MKKIITLLLVFGLVLHGYAQITLPTFYNLSSGTYILNGWDSAAPAGSYPPNMKFYFTINAESSSGDGYDSSAEASENYNCPYNLDARNRIIGLNAGGFAFQATSSPQYNDCSDSVTNADSDRYVGVAEMGLNSTGKSNIGVKWVSVLIHPGDSAIPRNYAVRLQYRIGTTGKYTDVINNGDPVEFNSIGKDSNARATVTGTLPAVCDNQSVMYIRWVYFQDVYAGSGTRPEITVDSLEVGANLLPVNLLSFSAVLNGGSVSLAWQAVDEVDFSHYEVEKSIDAVSFTTIGEVPGKNTPGVNNYSFSDDKIITGNSFYRLKMVNEDGSFFYSGTVYVTVKATTGVSVYPNPVTNSVVLSHPQALSGATIQIIGSDGKRVSLYNVQLNAVQTSVDASKLVSGNYFVVYHNGTQTLTTPFVKQ